jgi:ferric-dicitrate binding protein FerR (iron transport regulator)
LQSWVAASDDNRQLYEQLTNDETLNQELKEYITQRRSAAQRRKEAEIVPMPTSKRTWLRYVAAACILILLSAVGYLWFMPTNKQVAKTEKKIIKDTIPAGRDGAILTLGDGKQIILDNAANGKLAEEGQTTITHKDGQISYKETKQQKVSVVYNTTSTPRGRQYKLQLSDGTAIWLNAASSVTYPTLFTGNKREISITGEVYLEVAQASSGSPGGGEKKPFIVHIANTNSDIEVLGTKFVVNAYNDEPTVKTTLLEGSIRLSTQVNGKNNTTVLKPGQQTRVSHENLELIKEANTEEATAFINGFFYFDHADIKTVMRQLEKWYDIEVSYTQPVSKKTFDGGIQRSLSLPVVLKILERNGAEFSVEGKRVQVTYD